MAKFLHLCILLLADNFVFICDQDIVCRAVFGAGFPVLLCIWHLQRNWLETLSKKVSVLRSNC